LNKKPIVQTVDVAHFSYVSYISDEDLHKLMDINKVFPKPPEVAAEIQRKRKTGPIHQ
jgi:hypothetical protein